MPTVGPCPDPKSLLRSVQAMLADAETIFGPRDPLWTYGGVTYSTNGPNLWFDPSSDVVKVVVNQSSVVPNYFPDQLLYQLSHETVHLLAPDRQPITSLMEEGAAVWFSLHRVKYWSDDYAQKNINDMMAGCGPNYWDAYRAYLELCRFYPDGIMRFRQVQSKMYDIDEAVLHQILPRLPASLVKLLCEKRKMR